MSKLNNLWDGLTADAHELQYTLQNSVPDFARYRALREAAPAALTSVNAQVNLTPEVIARHNVEVRPPLVHCPVVEQVGGDEPWHWIDQSFRYSHHLHRHGNQPEVHVIPDCNHFSIVLQSMQPDSPVGAATLRVAQLGRPML